MGRLGEALVNITGGAHATLAITNIGPVAIPSTAIGAGMGKVTVSGVNSQLSGAITIGGRGDGSGTGELEVSGGGLVKSKGTKLRIAPGGEGKVGIASGGRIEAIDSEVGIGLTGPGVAVASVSGAGSQWINTGNLVVGFSTQGTLTISDGGLFQNVNGDIGNTVLSDAGVGTVTVTGAATEWRNTGTLTVGKAGTGTLNVSDEGVVQSADGFVGALNGSVGAVTVTGAGTEWQDFGALTVGQSGTGSLNITAGGVVRSDDGFVGSLSGSSGAVTIDGFSSRWISSVDIRIGALGNGAVTVTNEGTVQAQNVVVESHGSLGGDGTIFSDVQNNGIVAPGASIGTLVINGAFAQQPGGALEIEVGGTSGAQVDLLNVGAATLNGELRLMLIAGTVPAVNVALTATSLTGQFDNVTNGQRLFTVDGGGSFVVNYGPGSAFNPNQIVLSAFQSATNGDFDMDGDVDGNDFLVWQRGGSPNPNSSTDLAVWRAAFGSAVAPAANDAVPEPLAAELAMAVAIVAFACGRCRRATVFLNGVRI